MKMYDYQQRAISSTEKTIVCNWSRALGKTYTLAQAILRNRPKRVVYINSGGVTNAFGTIQEKINEIIKMEDIRYQFSEISHEREFTRLRYFGDATEIYSLRSANMLQMRDLEFDYILFDEMLPCNIGLKAKQVISMVTINNHDRKIQRLYRLNKLVKIFEEDYKTGLKHGLLYEPHLKRKRQDNAERFYGDFAILEKPQDKERQKPRKVIHAKYPIDEYGRPLMGYEDMMLHVEQLEQYLPNSYKVIPTPFELEVVNN